ARFYDVPAGAGKIYLAEVTVAGRTYRAQPFLMAPAAGVVRAVLVHDQLLFSLQGGGQIDDDKMWFELSFSAANLTGSPYDAGPDGVSFPLPAEAGGASVKDEVLGD